MLVEFMGVPGCGKSTLAAALTRELEDRGVKARLRYREVGDADARRASGLDKTGTALRRLIGTPRAAAAAATLVARSRQRSLPEAFALLRFWLYLDAIVADERRACDVLLLHQGFAQLAWSIAFASGRDAADVVRDALVAMPVAELYVRVDVPVAVLAERLERRRTTASRLRHSHGESVAAIEAAHALVDVTETRLLGEGREVLHVDHADEDASRRAVTLLAERLSRGF